MLSSSFSAFRPHKTRCLHPSLDLLWLDLDSLRRCQLEFNIFRFHKIGAGGTEAALFAAELYDMYAKFAARSGTGRRMKYEQMHKNRWHRH
uniref:Peptide chain release factor domain-containing protein n=2 Tax=Globodera rostochiensis TaxID=31243 RepID=A0A914GVP2_GLORO